MLRKPSDYIELFDDNRIVDADGESGHTIYVNKAIEICQNLEIYYLNRLVEMGHEINTLQNKIIELQQNQHE